MSGPKPEAEPYRDVEPATALAALNGMLVWAWNGAKGEEARRRLEDQATIVRRFIQERDT